MYSNIKKQKWQRGADLIFFTIISKMECKMKKRKGAEVMAYDALYFKYLARELNEELSGRKVEKIFQHSDRSLSLSFSRLKDKRLYIDISPNHPRILLSEDKLDNPFQAPMFLMLARKNYSSATLKSVRQRKGDRILEFCFEARNELHDISDKYIIVEIMGKHSNLILADENFKVLDALKHVNPLLSKRSMGPGVTYSPPFEEKPSFLDTEPKTLIELIKESRLGLVKAIYANIGGLSPQSAISLLVEADLTEKKDVKPAELSEEELQSLSSALNSLHQEYLNTARARIYQLPDSTELSITELKQYRNEEVRYYDSANEACHAYFKDKTRSDLASFQKQGLQDALKVKKEKEELKLRRLHEDIEKAENYDIYRMKADALIASPQDVKKGESSCRLLNYHDGSYLDIEIDSRLSPQKNAANYYKLYEKNKRAIDYTREQIALCSESLNYLESVILSLDDAHTQPELSDIERELESLGYIKARQEAKAKGKKLPKNEFRSFQSPGGFTLRLGKNNVQNDELSLKLSSKNHIWFHTKDITSSHAVLMATEQEAEEEDILFAAGITAFYSKARQSQNVPVDYTLIKHVKKPSGSPPGKVIYVKQRTVYVDPLDPASLEK